MIFFDCETTGLAPIEENTLTKEREFKRIISIAYSIDDGEVNCIASDNEVSILNKFWQLVALEKRTAGEAIVCGFVVDFDLTFLRVRSLANDIGIDDDIKILDLRSVINPDKYAKGKLKDYCKMLGIPVETQNGSQMLRLYEDKNWEEISKHNKEDVVNTKLLYDKLNKLGFLEKWRRENKVQKEE